MIDIQLSSLHKMTNQKDGGFEDDSGKTKMITSVSFQVNGEDNRVQLWKDQLALQMIMMVSHFVSDDNEGKPLCLK